VGPFDYGGKFTGMIRDGILGWENYNRKPQEREK